MKKEYKVITKGNVDKLVKEVNRLYNEGWLPQGGISYYYFGFTQEQYSQAMIKEN